MTCLIVIERGCSWSSAGVVLTRLRIWFRAWMRALTHDARVGRSNTAWARKLSSGSLDFGHTPHRLHEERPPARRILPFGLAVPGPMPGKTGRSPLGTVSESAQAEDVTQASNLHDEVIKTAVAAELRRTPDINDTRIGVAVDHGAVTLSGEVELQDG